MSTTPMLPDPNTLLERAQDSLRNGDLDQASASFKRLMRRNPGEGSFGLAQIAAMRMNVNQALEHARDARNYLPDDDPRPLSLLASLTLESNRPDDALTFANHALELDPEHIPALMTKARILRLQDRTGDALETLETLRSLNPDASLITVEYASALREVGRIEEAIELASDVLKTDPYQPSLYTFLTETFLALQQPDLALELLERTHNADPSFLFVNVLLLDAYQQLGHDEKAVSLCELTTELALTARDSTTLADLAQYHTNRDAFQRAEELLRKAIAFDSQLPNLHHQLGRLLLHQNQVENAAHVLQHTLSLAPDHIPALLDLSSVCLDIPNPNNYITARTITDKILERLPDHPHALFNNALAHARLDEPQAATTSLNTLLSLPTSPFHSEAQRLLNAIQDAHTDNPNDLN